ncbi:sodium:proton antiporter [Shewanella sp. AS16]|uniref:Na+/H+ antiporter NhaC family protein n=1 Tax=Shewanella sp. AS16 TaxID=2907625 RepID=UPI001F210A92|nr:Na+/H+ antiporter NhaC family protein [Shewanella sp. AS16]MCE9686007.1 sodium:proton antiporter [Shewanella sp. AS16]
MQASLVSLLPLVLTLLLALTLRRTLLALGAGVLCGSLLLADWQPLAGIAYLWQILSQQFYAAGAWQQWHLNVLAAMALLGMMTQLLARGGAVEALGQWLYLRVRREPQARIGIVLLGWLVFIDGIFSCLAVGHVCQPLVDRYGISRRQLAYLVDSTASPLCALLPFSTWGPYVMALLAGIGFLPVTPLSAFLQMAQVNFYAVLTLGIAAWAAWSGMGFPKPKSRAMPGWEKLRLQAESQSGAAAKANPWLLGVPILTLLGGAMVLTLCSGARQVAGWDLSLWLAKADIGAAMRDASLLACLLTLAMLKGTGRSLSLLWRDLALGFRLILYAIAILLFTWMIGAVIRDLGVASLLAGWAELYLSSQLLLAGMFLLCALMAFATGSSWGTFAIMIPIGSEIAAAVAPGMLLPALSAVMAGSVFGDHCSPISDTSVLSATSSGCEPHEHVVSQLPFVLIAAVAALLGYQLLNVGMGAGWVWLSCVSMVVLSLALAKRYYGPWRRLDHSLIFSSK